jgi:hypothetical protein
MKKRLQFDESITPLEKKLHIISSEMDIMRPDTLLLNADPSIDAIEIIEQIHTYCTLLNKEIGVLVKYFNFREIKSPKKTKYVNLLKISK